MARVQLIAVRVLRRPDGAEPGAAAWPIGATGIVIGRAPDCDLVLEDPLRLVSRQHAQLLPQGANTAMLRCISATTSIGVDGDALPPGGERLVHPGDRLRLGGFELQIEAAEGAAAAVPPWSGAGEAVAPLQMLEEVLRGAPVAAAPVPAPPAPVLAPAPEPVAAAAPVAARVPAALPVPGPAAVRSRLDQWFDLDTVADPLDPGSPLPAAGAAAALALAMPAPTAPPRAAAAAAVAAIAELTAAIVAEAPPCDAPAAVPQPTTVDDEALMRAFLRGAGLSAGAALPAGALNAAWMQHLGALLRAATEGTLALLRSRAVTKRSIRAEGTRIALRENNPLKFAPDAAGALALLVGKQSAQGFLDPVEAVRDAHNDLLVHQLAMVAGMRAAVFELISRLGPEAIEAQQGPAKGLARHLPLLQDAALWRRHRQQHAHLIANLDDDFEAVFGREFLLAYEAQSRLAAPPPPANAGRA